MQITKKTKVKEVLPFLNEEKTKYLLENIPEYPLDKPIISMTIGEFSEILLDEQAYIQTFMSPKERAYKAFGRLRAFKREMDEIQKWMNKFEIKQSAEEKQAAIGIEFPNFVTKILITVVQFFSLHSFKEAEEIPLADYLVILQDQSSQVKYQRQYSKILEMKQHGK